MRQKHLWHFVLLGLVLFTLSAAGVAHNTQAAQPQAIQAPVLKWAHGGCYNSWCETGWYASPAVADLDGNGSMEVLAGAYSLFILNGETGDTIDSINTPGGRIWPGVVVADLDGDEDDEIVIAQGGGYLNGGKIRAFDQLVTAEDIEDHSLLLRAGKKRYMKVILE